MMEYKRELLDAVRKLLNTETAYRFGKQRQGKLTWIEEQRPLIQFVPANNISMSSIIYQTDFSLFSSISVHWLSHL